MARLIVFQDPGQPRFGKIWEWWLCRIPAMLAALMFAGILIESLRAGENYLAGLLAVLTLLSVRASIAGLEGPEDQSTRSG